MSKEQQSVVVAQYITKYGTLLRLFKTDGQALQWRTEIAMASWNGEFPDYPKPEDCNIGSTYFSLMRNRSELAEYFQINLTIVEGD
jgi:hypothetical protein